MNAPAPAPSPAPAPAPAAPGKMNLSPQAQAELAELMVTLSKDEKVGKAVKRRITELDPSKRFVDVESDDLNDKVTQEFEKRDLAEKARKQTERLEAQRAGLVTSGRFTDDDVKEIEKLMEKHGIADYEIGAKVYASDRAPANPVPDIQSRNWEMPKMDKELMSDPKAFARKKANNVVAEMMKNRQKRPHA